MSRIRPLMLLLCTVMLLNSGCLLQGKKQDRWKPIEQNTAPVVHEIQWKAETLSIISKWYTGDSQNRKSLADANPNINPHSLFLGNRIFIPSHLAKTRDPMTKEFVTSCYNQLSKKKKKPAASKKSVKKKVPPKKEVEPAPEEMDDFEVIGPK